ncbi:MAG: UDP-2,3-diacylglucosamine diphosphatase [Halomonas sp.]|uniref:UDP-2,3-diacylglucosamine diphosphatase n=1 Tax=Halomonas sp. TaxID=1486246 RepID=UPI0019E2435E|nr:UDP-2,3-diacylglucosamine diphosphatase [Halomonas sp.]MBE0489903.1 UDP-2,3-diacylglucosamine diphosphatase [Halomonas sp.]
MTIRLISDLHLHPGAPEITEGFLHWLETRACGCDALYLLGDIFEAWIGDDLLDLAGVDPSGNADLALRVARALRRLADDGTELYLMHGNRDFLLGERFAEEAGVTLLPDPSVVAPGGKRILLMHGDSLCTLDTAYQAFRAQARDPLWQAQVLSMPLPERIALAKQLREQSGEANSNKAEAIMDVTPEEVVRVMDAQGVTTLIHGHTHRPAVHDLSVAGKAATRFVLGDWQPGQGWEIVIEEGQAPRLQHFALGG